MLGNPAKIIVVQRAGKYDLAGYRRGGGAGETVGSFSTEADASETRGAVGGVNK